MPDLTNIREILPPPTPTLRSITHALFYYDSDRTVLVRNPGKERPVGFMVFCLGADAQAQMIPAMFEIKDSINQESLEVPRLGADEDLSAVFAWMDAHGLQTCSFGARSEGNRKNVMVFAFVGHELCERLRPILDSVGAFKQLRGEGEDQ